MMKCRGNCGRDVEEGLYCDKCLEPPPGTMYLRQFIFEDRKEAPQDTEEGDQETLK
jgi:hypothetical protein